mmetsp:Transcript_43865/g.102472  ORF Transcript_43865/g.102472 Transcript_43865/m.102472 type:complete len:897 (-) Transcript_43865:142-2832(-)
MLDIADEDKRRHARWNLKRAMHDRRIADIEKALIAGEECSLYPMELEHARHTLVEARKAEGHQRLEKALKSANVEIIRDAIDQAASVGVSQMRLQAAEAFLEMVKRQEDARLLVSQAQRSGDVELMRQAITDATSMGLSDHELARVRQKVEKLELQAREMRRLELAVHSKSVAELQDCIASAVMAGLSAPDLEKGRQVLQKEESKAAARIILKDARLGKKASAEERVQDLREAVEQGKSAGLTEDELVPFVNALADLRREVAARRALNEAVEIATIDALMPAVQEARAAGVDEEDLATAKMLIEDAYKPAARAKLKDAVQKRDIPALQAAIEHAKVVGLSVMAIAEASEVLKEEELKVQLRKRLLGLHGSTNQAELRSTINISDLNGLTKAELAPARKQLAELEQQDATAARLEEAIAAGEIAELQAVIKDAKALVREVLTPCIPEGLIERSEKALRSEIEKAAQDMLFDSIKRCSKEAGISRSKDVPEENEPVNPKAALQQRRRSQANFEAALQAVGVEVSSRPGSREATSMQGRRTSGLGKRRMSAMGPGAMAQSNQGDEYFQRMETIRTAITGAEALGLEEAYILPARQALAEQEKKFQANAALAQARKLKSLDMIKAALEQAQEAGLSHMEMKQTIDAQKDIKRRDEAAEKLEDAVDARDEEKLRWAIKWAKEAKVDEDDIADAEEVMEELEKRQQALAKLEAAEKSRDVQELIEALEFAAEHNLEEDELEPYEEALLEERQRVAKEAMSKAMELRDIPALKEALKLAEEGEIEDSDEAVDCHRVLAEELVLQALRGCIACHKLRAAVEEALEWAPDFDHLKSAQRTLAREEKRDAARAELQGAYASKDVSKLAAAIRQGRAVGLEDWEMRNAEKALDAVRTDLIDDFVRTA